MRGTFSCPVHGEKRRTRSSEVGVRTGMRAGWVFAVLAICLLGGCRAAAQGAAAAPQLAIIDTDIGDDIDDAFALALALESPELKVLGVTTTFGDTELRARLVDRCLKAIGRTDIPVAAGPKTSAKNIFTQAAYARRALERKHADAVAFLLGEIRKHPGEITLIGIGPLVNVQAAIEKDAATFRKLRRVVIMGGSIDRGYGSANGQPRPPDAEWNILCDPAGLKALLASGVPVFMMPLDSTQIRLDERDRDKLFAFGSPLTDQLTLLYHQWLEGSEGRSPTPTLYDPVAVTYAIRPELCPAAPMHVDVDDKGFTRRGEGAPNAQVCLKSDEKGFLELLTGRIEEIHK